MAKITVKHPEPKIKTEILAEAIVRISDGFTKLQASGLNERAIVVLIHGYEPGISKTDIKAILGALRQLSAWYCR